MIFLWTKIKKKLKANREILINSFQLCYFFILPLFNIQSFLFGLETFFKLSQYIKFRWFIGTTSLVNRMQYLHFFILFHSSPTSSSSLFSALSVLLFFFYISLSNWLLNDCKLNLEALRHFLPVYWNDFLASKSDKSSFEEQSVFGAVWLLKIRSSMSAWNLWALENL